MAPESEPGRTEIVPASALALRALQTLGKTHITWYSKVPSPTRSVASMPRRAAARHKSNASVYGRHDPPRGSAARAPSATNAYESIHANRGARIYPRLPRSERQGIDARGPVSRRVEHGSLPFGIERADADGAPRHASRAPPLLC